MKKLMYLAAMLCVAVLTACTSNTDRIDKFKELQDEYLKIAEEQGPRSDAAIDAYEKYEEYGRVEIGKVYTDFSKEELEYYTKIAFDFNREHQDLWYETAKAAEAKKAGDPNYGVRPDDRTEIEKAADAAKDAAKDAADAATSAVDDAKDAAKTAVDDAAAKAADEAKKLIK